MRVVWMLVLPAALAALLVPWFLKEDWPRRSARSTLLKGICSALFVVAAALAARAGKAPTPADGLMLAGFCLSLLGDVLLDLKSTPRRFLGGLLAFLSAHLCFTGGFASACAALGRPAFAPWEAVAAAALFVGFSLAQTFRVRLRFGTMLAPAACYCAAILAMLVKALSLGAALAPLAGGTAAAALAGGALLFVASDIILCFNVFGGRKSAASHAANIATYYAGQFLLAASLWWF